MTSQQQELTQAIQVIEKNFDAKLQIHMNTLYEETASKLKKQRDAFERKIDNEVGKLKQHFEKKTAELEMRINTADVSTSCICSENEVLARISEKIPKIDETSLNRMSDDLQSCLNSVAILTARLDSIAETRNNNNAVKPKPATVLKPTLSNFVYPPTSKVTPLSTHTPNKPTGATAKDTPRMGTITGNSASSTARRVDNTVNKNVTFSLTLQQYIYCSLQCPLMIY